MNVYPEDVENALLEEPGVTEAVVLGREQDSDIVLHAVLLLQPGADAEAIVRRANKRLAPHQRVKGHTVWPERDFPRTHTLKPKRDEILRLLTAQEEAARPGIRAGV
jgi:long-chain acyl-CoA synthetase